MPYINGPRWTTCKFQPLWYWSSPTNELHRSYVRPREVAILELNIVHDLGISMSNEAMFHAHIAKIVIACRQIAGWILRTFRARDQETMLTLRRSLVLSHLDYCFQLWSPHSVRLIGEIEAVQLRCFTKEITSMKGWGRLKELHLYSLERRWDGIYSDIHKEDIGVTGSKLWHRELNQLSNRRTLHYTDNPKIPVKIKEHILS